MGWHPLGDEEWTGDETVEIAREALARLGALRAEGAREPLGWPELGALLTHAVARSSRELLARKGATFAGLAITLSDGSTVTTEATDAKPVADELAILRDAVKRIAAAYKDVATLANRKRPSAHEVAATFRLAAATGPISSAEERTPTGIVPRFVHAEGLLEAPALVAILAAAFRRNERRLGLLVENGAAMRPEAVIGVAASGEVRAEVDDAQADRGLVEDMCDRIDAIVREHRQEQPEKALAALSPADRERYQRNVDARGVPTLEALVERLRKDLGRTPERYAPLTSLRVETSSRSALGLPSRPVPKTFVDSRLRVRHGKFGEGFVERTFEDGEKKYEVVFDNGKRATLMAKFLEEVG